ncbi:MAG: endonuclease/exonuclease/phosphatase family protein [Roseiflexaceae bacterium]
MHQPSAHRSSHQTLSHLFVVGYCLFVVLFAIALRSPLADWWGLQLIAVIYPWLYAPVLIMVMGQILRRRWRRMLLLSLPVVLLVGEYGTLMLPEARAATAAQPRQQLRVMSWNVLFRNTDSTAVAATILSQNADLVALQELGTPLAADLQEQLKQHYPYQVLAPRRDPGGFGLLSRYPIVHSDQPSLSNAECRCQRVQIAIGERIVTLINTHPATPKLEIRRVARVLPLPNHFATTEQEQTFDALIHQIDRETTPVLLVGDFNLTDRQASYQRFHERLRDVHAEVGWGLGLTFPTSQITSLIRIDYIWIDEFWQPNAIWTVQDLSSDHRAVIADLTLQ